MMLMLMLQHHRGSLIHLKIGQFVRFFQKVGMWSLVSLATPQEATVVEHVFAGRIQRPIVSFARIARFTWNFDETIVQAQIVTYRVLPIRIFSVIVGKSFANKVTNAGQREPTIRRLNDGHCDQCDVRVRRFDRVAVFVQFGRKLAMLEHRIASAHRNIGGRRI